MQNKPKKTHIQKHFKGVKFVKCLITGRKAKYIHSKIDFNPKHKNTLFMDSDNYVSVVLWTKEKGYAEIVT